MSKKKVFKISNTYCRKPLQKYKKPGLDLSPYHDDILRKLIRWLPAVLWMSVIFYLSDQSGDDLHSFLPFFNKLFPAMKSFDWGHFAAYFILACTYLWGLGVRFMTYKGKALVVFLCILYGITDEYHQSFVDGRTPDLLDIRNDAIGAILAMIVVSVSPFKHLYMKLLSTKKY